MREAHPTEAAVGIEYYVSETDGTGGRLRDRPGDFRVEEQEAFGADLRGLDADVGSYPHLVFRATLRGWDTNDFASTLSKRLGVSRERVSWAGTKDKHAVTTQLFSIKHPDDELPSIDGARVELLGRAGRPVLFGDLTGNDFEVVVRDAARPGNADPIAAELRRFGLEDASGAADGDAAVPNYFGQQRFGSMRPITHRVGLDVVRGEWEHAAVRYVCESSEREPERTRAARQRLGEDREWERANELLPGGLRFERAIAGRLAEGTDGPADYRAALETLPTNLQAMFTNAAQSYVFNRVLSERLRRGLRSGRRSPATSSVSPTATAFPIPAGHRSSRPSRSGRSGDTASGAVRSSPRRSSAPTPSSDRGRLTKSSGRCWTTSVSNGAISTGRGSSVRRERGGRSCFGPISTSPLILSRFGSRCRRGATRPCWPGSS